MQNFNECIQYPNKIHLTYFLKCLSMASMSLLDWSQLFLKFAQVLERLLRLKRLIWIYFSKFCCLFDAFNLLLKLIDFENSMNMAAVKWKWKLSVLIMLLKITLQRYDITKKVTIQKKKPSCDRKLACFLVLYFMLFSRRISKIRSLSVLG